MHTAVVLVIAAAFLAMGGYALVAPAAIARPFGTRVDTPDGRSEIRAVYGGFGLAVAVMLALAAFGPGGLRDGVIATTAAALAGMAVGRLISRLVDQPVPFYPVWLFFWIETIAAAVLFAMLP
ncbi:MULTISPECIES: DUF4345 domain-containing protein [unclassified Nocardia]|uniref:DUF4345 domain-containing protein n=1 Tax=unclassified Nocardia TaxID=2637762 RepID=UPI0024A82D26|nr:MULTISPECIES: DUF4345 domain-containing protein [unclassified Nocardia]